MLGLQAPETLIQTSTTQTALTRTFFFKKRKTAPPQKITENVTVRQVSKACSYGSNCETENIEKLKGHLLVKEPFSNKKSHRAKKRKGWTLHRFQLCKCEKVKKTRSVSSSIIRTLAALPSSRQLVRSKVFESGSSRYVLWLGEK